MMHTFFIPKSQSIPPATLIPAHHLSKFDKPFSAFELVDYPSNEGCEEDKNENNEYNPTSDDDTDDGDNAMAITISKDSEPTKPSANLQTKWRKFEILVHVLKAQ